MFDDVQVLERYSSYFRLFVGNSCVGAEADANADAGADDDDAD